MATPAVVQFASQDTNGGGGSNTTLPVGWVTGPTTVGNRILSLTVWADQTSTVTSVTDANSLPYSDVSFTSGTGSGNNNSGAAFISNQILAGNQPTVTVHAGTGSPLNWEAWNMEISGTDSSVPVNGLAWNSAASGTSPTCTINVTQSSCLLIAYAVAAGAISAGPGGSWTDFAGVPTVDAYWMSQMVTGSTGNYTATFTGDGTAWGVMIIAFQSTSTAPSFKVLPTDVIFYGIT